MAKSSPNDVSKIIASLLAGITGDDARHDGYLRPNDMPENLQDIVREICQKSSTPVPKYLGLKPDTSPVDAFSTTSPYDGAPAIFVGPGMYEALGDNVSGVLAHELGHISLGHDGQLRALYDSFPGGHDSNNPLLMNLQRFTQTLTLAHRQELEADAFAKTWGHGPQLAACLRLEITKSEEWGLAHFETLMHPSTEDRIRLLEGEIRHRNAA